MSYGMIEENALRSIFVKIAKHYNTNNIRSDENLQQTINMINEKISEYDQRIVKHRYGFNGLYYYIFNNTAVTSIAKLQNTFTQTELDFFKLILTDILENDELYIAPRTALNLQSSVKGILSKVRAEELIDMWTFCGYFYRDHDKIYLGPKSITELKEILQKMELNYIKTCMLCEELCVWGIHCVLCKTPLHEDCIDKYVARTDKCPSCKENWQIPMD
jgi:Nse1 non-SMC component of SMC5-6 complex/RING-like domain